MKKIFFASDFHLGAPTWEKSRAREDRLVRWLDQIAPQAEQLFLVGDVFDFWFEYQSVVPKGYIRLLGKLAQLREQGLPIHLFVGNHDLWLGDYLQKELGITIYHQPQRFELLGKQFYIGHGDGLGPGDHGYKFLKKIFTNRFCRWLFRWLHPDIGTRLASYLSRKSRAKQLQKPDFFRGETDEWLLVYSQEMIEREPTLDYLVFGHRHLALDIVLKNGRSRYINLGEWLSLCSYGVFDGERMELRYFGD